MNDRVPLRLSDDSTVMVPKRLIGDTVEINGKLYLVTVQKDEHDPCSGCGFNFIEFGKGCEKKVRKYKEKCGKEFEKDGESHPIIFVDIEFMDMLQKYFLLPDLDKDKINELRFVFNYNRVKKF